MDRQEQVEEDIKEVWHLERDLAKDNAPGISSASSSSKVQPTHFIKATSGSPFIAIRSCHALFRGSFPWPDIFPERHC